MITGTITTSPTKSFIIFVLLCFVLQVVAATRSLKVGDFDSYNELLQGTELSLPGTTLNQQVAGFTLSIQFNDIRCRDVYLGDVQFSWKNESSETIDVHVDVLSSNLICESDYRYEYVLGTSGSGTVIIYTKDNNATATLNVTTSAAQITRCTAALNVYNLDFQGGLVASFLSAVEKPFRNTVETELEKFICDNLANIDDNLDQVLTKVSTLLDPYLNETRNSTDLDPLLLENSLQLPKNMTVVNFRKPDSKIALAVTTLIEQMGSYLGTSESGSLQINRLIQMTGNGEIDIDLTKIPEFPSNGTLFQGSNDLGEMELRISSIKLTGLDTFSKFDGLNILGNFTLGTSIALEGVTIFVDAELEIKPPNATSKTLIETMQLAINLENIEASVALLLVLDAEKLGAMPIGSLIRGEYLLQCLMSTVYQLDIAALQLQPIITSSPVLSGIESPGFARLCADGADMMYALLEPMLLPALSNYLRTAALSALDTTFQEFLGKGACITPDSSNPDALVDMRDLLLPTETAKSYGGSGSAPYGGLVTFLKEYIDDELLSTEACSLRINKALIEPWTKAQSGVPGTFALSQDLINFDRSIAIEGFEAQVEFRIWNIRIENLASLGSPVSIANPVPNEAFLLNNTAIAGVFPNPIRFTVNVLLGLQTKDDVVRNEVVIGVEVTSVQFLVEAMIRLLEEEFLAFPIEDITNLDCLLASLQKPILNEQGLSAPDAAPSLYFPLMQMDFSDVNFTIDCVNCTSPVLKGVANRVKEPEAEADSLRSARNVVKLMLSLIEGKNSFFETLINRRIADAPKRCPHRREFDPTASSTQYAPMPAEIEEGSDNFLLAMLLVVFVLAAVVVIVTIAVRFLVRKRNKRWLASISDEQAALVHAAQQENERSMTELNKLSTSLVRSLDIPRSARWFVPLVILGNIGLFLSGHFSTGGSVRIYIQIAGQELVVDDFYTFSIAQSILELWKAGAKQLAILVFIVSVLWPYVKQLMTLWLWFAPPTLTSMYQRGKILLWLDVLAKWSMVDVFVMIISLSAFRGTIQSPDLSFLPESLYRVDLMVVPVWGLYANMIAQLVSQLNSHFIIYYHRRVESQAISRYMESQSTTESPSHKNNALTNSTTSSDCDAENGVDVGDAISDDDSAAIEVTDKTKDKGADYDAIGDIENIGKYDHNSPTAQDANTSPFGIAATNSADPKEPLCKHTFTRPHRGEDKPLHIRRGVNVGVALVGVCLVAGTVAGCVLSSLSYDVQGIVGIAIESGNGFAAAKEYVGIISLAELFMDEGRFLDTGKDKVGMLSIAFLLVSTTLVVPIALVGVLLSVWFLPMKSKLRDRLEVVVEILEAWQYIEVYLLSIIIGGWQLGDLSEMLVDSYCDGLKQTFTELRYFGVLSSDDAQCFRVQADIEPATYVLIGVAALLTFLTTFVLKAVRQLHFFRKQKDIMHHVRATEEHDIGSSKVKREEIHPVPFLFSDQFRWFLTSTHISSCE